MKLILIVPSGSNDLAERTSMPWRWRRPWRAALRRVVNGAGQLCADQRFESWSGSVRPCGRGRQSARYIVSSQDSKAFDDPGKFVQSPLVNRLRPRVQAWREAGYPGVSGVIRRLLEYWNDPEEFGSQRFFFCQIEAAETLIRLTEALAADEVGVEIPSDGGAFRLLCAKMAAGSSKTVVMALAPARHSLNKATVSGFPPRYHQALGRNDPTFRRSRPR